MEEKALPPLSRSEETTWAMLAHLSILLNLLTGFVGVIVPLVIYLIYKARSQYVAFQSLQAFVFQLAAWTGAGFIASVSWALTLSTGSIGCLCAPTSILLSLIPLGALVYGVIGGIKCSQGLDFQYWLIGEWLKGLKSQN